MRSTLGDQVAAQLGESKAGMIPSTAMAQSKVPTVYGYCTLPKEMASISALTVGIVFGILTGSLHSNRINYLS
jgi:hypothetical protein